MKVKESAETHTDIEQREKKKRKRTKAYKNCINIAEELQ